MFKLICVTNRALCRADFIGRLGILYKNGVEVILREKDLTEAEYEELARKTLAACPDITLHTFTGAAKCLGADKIHLPFHMMNETVRADFKTVGLSVHSAAEAAQAREMDADYVTAGHIFATACKKGLAPRGTEFLQVVAATVDIPVYAIGGITPDNIGEIRKTGAAGACIMSGLMTCSDAEDYINQLKERIK